MNSKQIFIVFAVSLMLLAVATSDCSAKSSTVLGSMKGISFWEIQTAWQLAQYINQCSTLSGYESYNWYGYQTNTENIYEAAYGHGHTFALSFYVGHGGTRIVPIVNEIHYDMEANDGTWVADDWIYPHTQCRNLRFAFLWSCTLGNEIGGTHFWTGPFGMPHCMLHTTDLSSNGYASPDGKGYTFIGFNGVAPVLTWKLLSIYCEGYYFAGYFYRYAFQDGTSINEALDWAAYYTFGVDDFAHCILYQGFAIGGKPGKMVVYGDGSLEIGSASSTPPPPPPPPRPSSQGGAGGGGPGRNNAVLV